MPIVLAIFIVTFLIFFTIISFSECYNILGTPGFIIAVFLSGLCIASAIQPLKIYDTKITTASDVDGSTVISYKGYDNNLEIVNLNEKLKKMYE